MATVSLLCHSCLGGSHAQLTVKQTCAKPGVKLKSKVREKQLAFLPQGIKKQAFCQVFGQLILYKANFPPG